METEGNKDRKKLHRAKKRLEELKSFYWHFASYLTVNIVISTFKIVQNMRMGESFGEAFWDFGTFAVWFFWGIGLAFHAAKVFGINPIFTKDWEKRQIKKYMEKDKSESKKYK